MLLMRPRDALIQNLSKQSGQAGGWRVQVCWKSFGIFDPPLPRIQAPVTRATAPVSRHATPWTNLQDWVWTRNVRCCGENFQWEKYGAGVEEGATGSSSRGVSLGKLPFYMFSVLTALEIRHLAERVKFCTRQPLAVSAQNSIELVRKKTCNVELKFDEQPGLNCKLQIERFLMEMKLTLKSGQATFSLVWLANQAWQQSTNIQSIRICQKSIECIKNQKEIQGGPLDPSLQLICFHTFPWHYV